MQAPYEAALIALINLITEVVKGQPPEVKAKLWTMYVEDLQKWRDWWGKFGNVFTPEAKAPEVKNDQPKT
jgi:hypothetical protein